MYVSESAPRTNAGLDEDLAQDRWAQCKVFREIKTLMMHKKSENALKSCCDKISARTWRRFEYRAERDLENVGVSALRHL